jgi:hypothetical protein
MLLTKGDAARIAVLPGSEFEVSGAGSPTLAFPTEFTEVCIGPRREPLPSLGTQFDLGAGALRHYCLPSAMDHAGQDASVLDAVERVGFHRGRLREEFRLWQKSCVGRPPPEMAGGGGLALGLQDFIDWQIGCFQELLDTDFARSALDEQAASIVRRDWAAGRASWLRLASDESDPARMSLIVGLSRNKELERTLVALCRSPRRVLERYRGKERLGRVEQLDAACLRWYARQPGRTAPEKAGPRQELLAVRRREAFDTLENRVLKWVLEEARTLTIRYLFENRRHRGSSLRCRDVGGFRNVLDRLLRSEPLASISSRLPHPVQPNYQLQQNPAYRLVWSTYLRLLAERRVQDDSWRWQRILWKETCQQVFSACLTAPGGPVRPAWPSATAYYRSESEFGRWTAPPTAPGPFELAGRGSLQVIDPREGAVPENWCPWLGALGGDLALLSFGESGQVRRGCVVWFHQDWSPGLELDSVVSRCASAVGLAAQQAEIAGRGSVPVDGLLLLNGRPGRRRLEVDEQVVPGTGCRVVAMRLPPDLHEHTADLRAGVDLLLEQLVA